MGALAKQNPPRNQTAPQPFIVKQGTAWLTGQAGLALVDRLGTPAPADRQKAGSGPEATCFLRLA
jgi:hypothetical protein